VIPYIRVSIRDTDIHSLVFQHPWDLPKHLLRVLLGISATLCYGGDTKIESSMPLSITQSKVSFSKTSFRFLASAWTSTWLLRYTWMSYHSHCFYIWVACPPQRSPKSQYWWCFYSRPHTSPRWKANCLYRTLYTSTNIQNFAISFDVLRNNVA
jgi:hypothetical protein